MSNFPLPFATIIHECAVDNKGLYFTSHEVIRKNLILKNKIINNMIIGKLIYKYDCNYRVPKLQIAHVSGVIVTLYVNASVVISLSNIITGHVQSLSFGFTTPHWKPFYSSSLQAQIYT